MSCNINIRKKFKISIHRLIHFVVETKKTKFIMSKTGFV